MESWRVAILGDGDVGKTALVVQTYDPTIEDAYRKQFMVDNKMCFIEVIDTTGQDEYATLRDQWVREGQGFVLLYSVTSRTSFERLEVFHQMIRKVKRLDPVFILVGNNCHEAYAREVSKEEGIVLARRYGCAFLEASAATAQNVELVFANLIRLLRQARNRNSVDPGASAPTQQEKKANCVVM